VLVDDGQDLWTTRGGLIEGGVERTVGPRAGAGEAGYEFRSQLADRHGCALPSWADNL
jgi:hypothetical protein